MKRAELNKLTLDQLREHTLELWDKLKSETGDISFMRVYPFNGTRADLNAAISRLDKLKDFTSPLQEHDGIEQSTLDWIKA